MIDGLLARFNGVSGLVRMIAPLPVEEYYDGPIIFVASSLAKILLPQM